MPKQSATITAGILAAAATVYLYLSLYPAPFSRNRITADQQMDASALQVSLSATSEPGELRIDILNRNQDSARTFLAWDTPFDDKALDLGALVVKDAITGEMLPGPGLKLNRMLPPPLDDLIEVPAGGQVSKYLRLKSFWLPSDGRKVIVNAEGEWKAVWEGRKQDVSEAERQALGGDRAAKGSFTSEPAQVDLQKT